MHLVPSGSLGGFGSAQSPLDLGPNLGPIGGGGLGGQSVGLGGQSLGGGQSVGFGVGQSGLGGQSLGGQSVLGGQSLGGQNVGLGGQSMGGQNMGLGVGQSGLGGHSMGGPPPGLSSQGVQLLGGLGKCSESKFSLIRIDLNRHFGRIRIIVRIKNVHHLHQDPIEI